MTTNPLHDINIPLLLFPFSRQFVTVSVLPHDSYQLGCSRLHLFCCDPAPSQHSQPRPIQPGGPRAQHWVSVYEVVDLKSINEVVSLSSVSAGFIQDGRNVFILFSAWYNWRFTTSTDNSPLVLKSICLCSFAFYYWSNKMRKNRHFNTSSYVGFCTFLRSFQTRLQIQRWWHESVVAA